MRGLNDLDKEIIRGNSMNTDVVREILHEMGSEDIPQPDYARIRDTLFRQKNKSAYTRRYNRWVAAAVALSAFFVLSTTAVFAARLIYEWITVVERVYPEQVLVINDMGDLSSHIGIDLRLPAALEHFSIRFTNDVNFGSFRTVIVVYERYEKMLTLTILYDFSRIEDVLFFVPNISTDANLVVNGIDVVYMRNHISASSFWEIDGIIYMLSGSFTEDELVEIIRSIP